MRAAGSLITMVFLGMFAVITPALISGAVADRMKFAAWAIFAPVWLVLVFVPVFKWVYGGWLGQRGSLDFAGGTAIHVNAGIAALAAVLVLGKRKGWPGEGHPPHSMPLVMLGTGILWFGWFGFNAGSALAANGPPSRRSSTPSSPPPPPVSPGPWSSASVTATSPTSARPPASWPASSPSRLVPASSPGCHRSTSALIAGVACCFAVGLKTKAGYDDALDVVGVHFVGGLVGSLLIGFFSEPAYFGTEGVVKAGVFHGGGMELARRAGARERRDDRLLLHRHDHHHGGPQGDHRRASL